MNIEHCFFLNSRGKFYAAKSVYQLQGELGNSYMWEKENVLSYTCSSSSLLHGGLPKAFY